MMLYIGLFVLVMVIVGAVLVYMNKDKLFKKKEVEVEEVEEVKEDKVPVVNITEDGSSIEEYRTGRENYISFPMVEESVSPYFVYAYNPNDSKVNSAMMGSDETWNSETGKCPDGTLDCLYYERITDGRVTAITDKNGKDLIKTFVDDFWDGKLTVYDENIATFDEMAQLNEGGQLIMSGADGENDRILKPGVTTPPGMFLLILMIKLKQKYPDTKPDIKMNMPAKTRKEFDEFFEAMNQQS